MQKEKIRWITVKGTHIPIKEGQTAKEATATFFARQNASYAEIVKETSQREQKKSDLTSNDGNGTITGEGLFRKKSNKRASHRIVISEKRFDELTVEARKKGAIIVKCQYGDDIFKHLEKNEATAACIGNVLFFRSDVTVSEVLEETHHFIQNLNRLNDDKPVSLRIILNEIEAKEFIINNAKKYNVPRVEVEETMGLLENYKKQLKEYYEG